MEKLLAMFSMFSLEYFIYLLLAAVIIVPLVFVLKKLGDSNKKMAEITIVSLMCVLLVLEYIGRIIGCEKFLIGDQLPINIFQIFVYISIFVLITKKESWIKFAYFIILPISVYGLLFYPETYLAMNSYSLATICYVLINTLLILYSLLLLFWNEVYLYKKDIITVSVNYVIILAAVHIINVFLRLSEVGAHANYFGTMGEEYDTLISLSFKVIPLSLLCLVFLLALLVLAEFLLILPFDVLKTKKEHQEQLDELIALGNFKTQQAERKKMGSTRSQILLRGEQKAAPKVKKDQFNDKKDGFVSVNKVVKTNNETKND